MPCSGTIYKIADVCKKLMDTQLIIAILAELKELGLISE